MGLRVLSGGESHGQALAVIVDGLPAGLAVSHDDIDRDLGRRQLGYGRGGRMRIESDRARIMSGIRLGFTTGAPVTVLIDNRDHENWIEKMSVEPRGERPPPETQPRPGHGDLAGMLKFGSHDARDVLERASARETAARAAAGALCRRLLEEVGVAIASRVVSIGEATAPVDDRVLPGSFDGVDEDPVRCTDGDASRHMVEEIDRASADGDSLGGVFEVAAFGLLPGLGSPAEFDRRLDGKLCGALASIPAIKGVEVGGGFSLAAMRGSSAHDEIFFESETGLYRETFNAGGLEAGMTNGEPLLLRAAMKPIPTLARPLRTVDLATLQPARAFKERADVCAVPAAAVVGEAVVALVLADAVLEKFGGDSMPEMQHNIAGYRARLEGLFRRGG